MTQTYWLSGAILGVVLMLGLACGVGAQNAAPLDAKAQDDVILRRQTLMESLYESANEEQLQSNAPALQARAASIADQLVTFKPLFPADTNPGDATFQATLPTAALPVIWQRFDEFSRLLDDNVVAARALAGARDPAQYTGLARRMLDTCEACHAEFRMPYQSPFDQSPADGKRP